MSVANPVWLNVPAVAVGWTYFRHPEHRRVAPPWREGNCLYLALDTGDGLQGVLSVLNMHLENFRYLARQLGLARVRVLRVGEALLEGAFAWWDCLVADARIPRAWLRPCPCPRCTPLRLARTLQQEYGELFRPG